MATTTSISAVELRSFVAALFAAAGLSPEAAARVSDALIEADLSGRGSHGVLQADDYLARLMAGAMATHEHPRIVSQSAGAIVLDAEGMEGHLAAESAMALAIKTARKTAIGAVAVRNGQHMGVAGRYARQAAEQGCAALVMGNTKPVMPAPGGIERLVGTNPLSIAVPASGTPIVLDMATSAGTYGRIRQARAQGREIPLDWALDANGTPTTDAVTAMAGLLLPMGGAKGFALSFVIDLMAGLFSGGAWGHKLGELDGDTSKPQLSSYIFIALDVAQFRPLEEFVAEADAAIARVHASRRASGVDRLFVPGERSAETLATHSGTLDLPAATVNALTARAQALGVAIPNGWAG